MKQSLMVLGFLVLVNTSGMSQQSLNMTEFGTLNPDPVRYSGSWGWTSPDGIEYALLGGYHGTHVIAIDDSSNIVESGFIEGQPSNWREITVIGDHAYVVTEGRGDLSGMQVIDLSPLPDSVHLVTTYTTTFTQGHIIMRDITVDSAIVYVSGTSTTGGVHMIDVSDPSNPVEVGIYDPPYYVHDAHVHGNLLFASALSVGLDIVDITDKSNPVLLSHISHPGDFTHSAWTTADLSHVVVTDEVDGLPARIWDIRNLDDPIEVAQFSANLESLVHNPYVLGDLVYLSHNTEGIRALDIADPSVPVEVGFFDTWDGPSGGFNGLWSAYPYFPSGKIIGGNREDGLHIWRFNGTRAGRIYGVVVDSATGEPLNGADIVIVETGRAAVTGITGLFALGELPNPAPGYTLAITAANYDPATVPGIALSDGDSLWFEIRLGSPVSTVADPSLPYRTGLLSNYPNPFNPQTTIGFEIASGGPVRLSVFDILGQEVVRLLDRKLQPGHHEVTWNGRDSFGRPAGSGIYLYRLVTDGIQETRTMILMK